MTYKIVTDALGEVVSYGPNDDNYVPVLQVGQTLSTGPTIPLSLAKEKEKQIRLVETAYQTIVSSPITYMGTTFQADMDSQNLLDGAVGKYTRQGIVPAGFWWKDSVNNRVTMTLAQLQGLADAIGDRIWTNFQILDTRKAAIRAATTISQVQGIVW